MVKGVGAEGHLGIGFETTPGTYVVPEKFVSIRSEGLNYVEDRILRRPLRGHADLAGVLPGNARIEGDVDVELPEDELVYWLRLARGNIVKSGVGPFVYTFSPTQNATAPNKTGSITVTRNAVGFGYVGMVVSSMEFTIDNGLFVGTFSLLGQDEADETVPTPTFSDVDPFAVGQYDIQVPTASQVFDTDTFSLTINDGAEAMYRLKNTGRGADFIKYGERAVTASLERDFEDRTEYDDFKALTEKSITIRMEKDVDHYIQFTIPVTIVDSYEISGLSGQADLIRASVAYQGTYDPATSQAYEIEVGSDEDITI